MTAQIKKRFLPVYFLFSFVFLISCTKQRTEDSAEKVGVVFSGGGAKGAYEIGVWKAFEEYGITKDIQVISGTSVGALNAALCVCTDSKTQEEIWRNEVGYFSFMRPDKKTLYSVGESLLSTAIESSGEDGVDFEEFGKNLLGKIGKGLLDYSLNDSHAEGLFDRKPLRKIIEKNVTLKKLNESGIDVYATALEKQSILIQYLSGENSFLYSFLLNEQINEKNVCDILLASSALPGIYQSQTLDKSVIEEGIALGESKEFVDGGFSQAGGENTPLAPLLKYKNLEKIFIVYLRHDPALRNFNDGESSAQIIHIVPSYDLGNMANGTVNFSSEKIYSLIELGYSDACKVLEENGYAKKIPARN